VKDDLRPAVKLSYGHIANKSFVLRITLKQAKQPFTYFFGHALQTKSLII